MSCLQNLTASPLSLNSDPLAIPVKKGEKFLLIMSLMIELLRGSNVLRGSCQNQTLFIYVYALGTLSVFMGLIHCVLVYSCF